MSNIHLLCNDILTHLTALGRQTAQSMLPGLAEEDIYRLTSGLPFDLPQSAVDLYKWSEGLKPGSGIGNEFFPGFGMDSLPQMIEMYRELSSLPDFPRFGCGVLQWFPLFRSGGSDFYAIRCETVVTVDAEIVYDDNDGPHRDCVTPPTVEFVSLEKMLRTILRAYETGAYFVDSQGRLAVGHCIYNDKGQLAEVDMSQFNALVRHYNPGLKRWN